MPSPEPVKFLLVDDLEENLLALEGLLRREGLQLFLARSGPEALELLLVEDFALALVDVQMPGMDGFELAELMRGTERTRRVPIIFLTAIATDERRRFRGYEAGAVDYLLKPVDPHMLRNKAEVFFELGRQRQELAEQRDQLRATAGRLGEALDRLQAHGDNSPLAVVQFDPEGQLVAWSKGAERMFGWAAAEVVGKPLQALRWVHEEDLPTLAGLITELRGGKQARALCASRTYRKDGSIVDCEWYKSALYNAAGQLISINAQVLDVTERRRAEEKQRLLIAELNHRVKNMLATVQAIATQTLRHSKDFADFSANFAGRIQSLARAHSLLSHTTWQGATLLELIRDQLGTVEETRLVCQGPDVCLAPQLSLHLALILHELGTNAHKYGALSSQQGRVTVNWTMEGKRLRLTWAESGGPPVRATTKRGFGTTLIEQSVKAEGGVAQVRYRTEGIVWDIALSLAEAVLTGAAAEESTAEDGQGEVTAQASGLGALSGRRFLVVEDEPLVAVELATLLEDAGAEVAGPVGAIEQALEMIERTVLDGALLDGNLRGKPVDEIAAALARRAIPFLFVSGYDREGLPRAFRSVRILSKPFTDQQLLEAAAQLLAGESVTASRPGPALSVKGRALGL